MTRPDLLLAGELVQILAIELVDLRVLDLQRGLDRCPVDEQVVDRAPLRDPELLLVGLEPGGQAIGL